MGRVLCIILGVMLGQALQSLNAEVQGRESVLGCYLRGWHGIEDGPFEKDFDMTERTLREKINDLMEVYDHNGGTAFVVKEHVLALIDAHDTTNKAHERDYPFCGVCGDAALNSEAE